MKSIRSEWWVEVINFSRWGANHQHVIHLAIISILSMVTAIKQNKIIIAQK